MRSFLHKLILYLIWPILYLGYVIFIGYNHNLHLTKVNDKKVLIYEPYNDNYLKWYKWQKNIDEINLIAIGASRVLQFKSDFFTENFFNLGYMVETPKQTLQMIRKKNIKNKIIILGLEQFAFNEESPNEINFSEPTEPNFLTTCFSSDRVLDILKFRLKPNINIIDNNILKIGAGANISLVGAAQDGSYYYGRIYHGLLTNNQKLVGEDYHFSNTIDRIKKGDRRFQYGIECDQNALNDFEDLVKYNQQNGNKVIYFFPPFAPTIQKLLKSKNYQYMIEASIKIKKIAEKYNVRFYDFTFLNSNDKMFIDGFHGGAELYFQIAKSMGLNTKDCQFKNPFETINDISYYKERIRFFSTSTSN